MYNLVQTGHLSKKKRSGYAREYFKKRLKRIGEILHLTQEEITKERVHELRLEIKKVKALFTLLRYSNNNFPAHKYYRPFKAIFKKAGNIRTVQVEQEILKQYISDSSDCYLDELQKLTHEQIEALKRMVGSNIVARLKSNKKEITLFLNKVTENRIKLFLKTNARKINKILEEGILKERKLHGIRKKLKSFYFVARTAYPDMIVPDPWNKLMELLGKWHDNQVAIEHLWKAIYSCRFHQDEVTRLYSVKREITENRENLFDQIVATFYIIENKEGAIIVPDSSIISTT